MAANHSSRIGLGIRLPLAILLFFVVRVAAQAQSSDNPSLGDVARTQRQKKPAANVIDNDEMVRRGFVNTSGNVRFECNLDCALKAKGLASYEFRHATEKEWQDAFAAAVNDLGKDDWGHRLAEIHEEICRNPSDLDSKPLNALENEMFSKMRREERAKETGETAVAQPDEARGAERQLQVKTSILQAKIELFQHACSPPAKLPAK
jgi:hypothetical protein